MLISLNDLPANSRNFARHCIENCTLRDVVEMIYAGKHEEPCSQFNLSYEQWQDAVYVVIKKMRQRK
jgi:hypothetical protein